MTSADAFTRATLTYADAVRSLRPHKSGAPLEVYPSRIRWLAWFASVLMGAIVGVSASMIGVGHLSACAVGACAGMAVRLFDGWAR